MNCRGRGKSSFFANEITSLRLSFFCPETLCSLPCIFTYTFNLLCLTERIIFFDFLVQSPLSNHRFTLKYVLGVDIRFVMFK